MLAIEVPVFLVQRVYESVSHGLVNLRALTAGANPATALHPVALAEMLALFGVLLVLVGVAQGGVMLAGNEAWHGRPVRPLAALAALGRRVVPLVLTYVLVLVLATLAAVVGALPGMAVTFGTVFVAASQHLGPGLIVLASVLGSVVVLVGVVVAALFLYLRWYVVVPTVVLEGLSGFGSLKRSAALMRGRVEPGFFGRVEVRASLLLLVVFFLLLVPQLLVGVPHFLLMHAYAPAKGVLDPLSVPFALRFPLELVELLLATVVTPFSVLASLVFYFDLRVRREGYDLELRARALGGEGAGG